MAAPTTVKVYDLDGVAKDFPVDFDYLAREFVVVTLLGGTRQELVLNVDFTFLNATTVRTSRATAWGPADGFTTIEVRRVTSAENRLVTFNDASILRAADLNLAELQTVHIAQEARDLVTDGIGTDENGQLDARNRRITNVLDPIEAQDAMTKNYYDSRINETKQYRDEAIAARDKANQWATQTPGAVEGGNFSAKQYALNAGASASAAATSEANADTSEANALASANAADVSEANALTYRNEAQSARDIAVSAKNDAEAAAAPAIEIFDRLDILDADAPTYIKKDGSRDYTGHQKLFSSTPTDPLHATSKGHVENRMVRNVILNPDQTYSWRGNSFSMTADGFMRTYNCMGMWVNRDGGNFVGGNGTTGINQNAAGETGLDRSVRVYGRYQGAFTGAGTNSYSFIAIPVPHAAKISGKWTFSFYAIRDQANPNRDLIVAGRRVSGAGGSGEQYASGATRIGITGTWQRFAVTLDFGTFSGWNRGTDGRDHVELQIYNHAGAGWATAPIRNFPGGALLDTGPNLFYVGGFQFEPGEVASPFQMDHEGEILSRQGHWIQMYDGQAKYWTYSPGPGQPVGFTLPYQQPMQRAPVVQFLQGLAAGGNLQNLRTESVGLSCFNILADGIAAGAAVLNAQQIILTCELP